MKLKYKKRKQLHSKNAKEVVSIGTKFLQHYGTEPNYLPLDVLTRVFFCWILLMANQAFYVYPSNICVAMSLKYLVGNRYQRTNIQRHPTPDFRLPNHRVRQCELSENVLLGSVCHVCCMAVRLNGWMLLVRLFVASIRKHTLNNIKLYLSSWECGFHYASSFSSCPYPYPLIGDYYPLLFVVCKRIS